MPQYRRVQTCEPVSNGLVITVNCEKILHQVVGAQRHEIDAFDYLVDRDHAGRHLDHRPDPRRAEIYFLRLQATLFSFSISF